MVEIEINGQVVQAESGSMIIEVADQLGISIPRFCYHKKLSIAANCRMCLVEVEKAPKPLPACATPITAGMKVYTASSKAKDAQRSVMEFLLINHPLDCPICDQGGECELQDVSLTYGAGSSRYQEPKRAVKDDNLGPLIATEMTRCIQCTRCVRFGQEVAGLRELGATGRGENMQITTYIKHSMESELAGNIIDLCPVGALTSKPFRFSARAWELEQVPTVAPHDCIGSQVYVHSLRDQVKRIIPREDEKINEMWLSDRDRFSYLALESEDRLKKPMIKIDGQWKEVDWITAFAFVSDGLSKIKKHYGAKQIAGLASPSATLEELFLLQKLLRSLGSQNIDHRLHQTDFRHQHSMPLYPVLGISMQELEMQDKILLIGANVQREQPIAGHRIRKATLRGAQVLSVNVIDYSFNFVQSERIISAPQELVIRLAGILKALSSIGENELPRTAAHLFQAVVPTNAEQTLAVNLAQGKNKIVILGAIAQNHPQAATIYYLAQQIAQLTDAKIGWLTEGANVAGAWLAGAVPHRGVAGSGVTDSGLPATAALTAHLKSYLLFNVEPELDCVDSGLAHAALEQAEFVVAFSPFKAQSYLNYANAILPIAAFTETNGTLINSMGQWQTVTAAVSPPGESKPGWKILRVLANELELEGFEYSQSEQIRDEVQHAVTNINFSSAEEFIPTVIEALPSGLARITEWPIYAIDSIVRRSRALQESASNDPVAVYMNEALAMRYHLQTGSVVKLMQAKTTIYLPVIITPQIPDACVLVHAGRKETVGLGPAFGAIEIHA